MLAGLKEAELHRLLTEDAKLGGLTRDFLKAAVLSDPFLFITHVLGYEVKEFHADWFRFQLQNRKTILLAPRGHGKTKVCNTAYILWHLARDQNLRVLIASKTARQAELFLDEIKQHIEKNLLFRWLFGDWFISEEWKQSQIRIPRELVAKEPTVTTIGIGGALPSWHFDLIIVDDPLDLKNTRTAGQRELVWQWYEQELLPTLEPSGKIHLIGTRWHPDDLFGRLMAKPGEYAVYVSKALRDNGTPLWPEKFPLEELARLRAEMGPTLFAMQYLCEAKGELIEGPVFKASDFRVITNEEADELAEYAIWRVQAWDVAAGTKEVVGGRESEGLGDYTACVTVAVTPKMEFVVLDWWRGRPPLSGQITAVKNLAAKWNPHAIGIEAVAYQTALANHLMTATGLPIVKLRPDRDKVRRALAIEPYVSSGRVAIAQRCLGLRDLLTAFPYGEEDDSVDAFVYAMWLATRFAERRGRVIGLAEVI